MQDLSLTRQHSYAATIGFDGAISNTVVHV